VQVGSYEVVYLSATEFEVFDPIGHSLGVGKNGTAFSNQIVFTATAGGTPFVAGDGFTIGVTIAFNQCTIVNSAATDGSQNAMGVVLRPCTANAGVDNVNGLVVLERGPAVLLADGLIWPAGATSTQIANWTAQLAKLNIVVRPS
jgi:hypothetical protein